jgi:hypothetical protein
VRAGQPCSSVPSRVLPAPAEWPSGLGKGLQSPVRGFDSRLRLPVCAESPYRAVVAEPSDQDLRRAEARLGELPPLAAEDHVCSRCGIAYPEVSIEFAAEVISGIPARARAAVEGFPAGALRGRPEPGVWSVIEYVCHLRDVYASYTIRLHRTRAEDRPALEPMFNDLRARRFGYNDRDVAAVLDELAATAAGFCEEITRTRPDEWERVASRLPSEVRTARWLVRQAMHEGVHHLGDIQRVAAAVTATG